MSSTAPLSRKRIQILGRGMAVVIMILVAVYNYQWRSDDVGSRSSMHIKGMRLTQIRLAKLLAFFLNVDHKIQGCNCCSAYWAYDIF
jgi:hypothetical protein